MHPLWGAADLDAKPARRTAFGVQRMPKAKVIRRRVVTMSETTLVNCILRLAQTLDYRRAHFLPARTNKGPRTLMQGDIGWPDITLCGHGRLIIIEAKGPGGILTPAQIAWLYELHTAGEECHVWYPENWHSGLIGRVLQGIEPKQEESPWWLQLRPNR